MNPLPAGIAAIEGPDAVIHSWSGGAFDTKRDRLIVWGGGHGAYAGNEVYVFDVNTLQWSRVTNPSSLSGYTEDGETMPDGRPKSVHTYDQLEYVPPPVDRFFATSGSKYKEGRITRSTWYFDFDNKNWKRLQDLPGNFYNEMLAYNMVSDYDPVSGKILFHGGYKSGDFNPATNSWTLHSNAASKPQPMGLTGALDPVRRKFVAIGRGNAFIYDVDKNGIMGPRQPLNASGATEIQSIDAPGLTYDPVSGKLVAWGGGKDVYTLDLSSKVWRRVSSGGSVSPGNPYSRTNYHGTFGRFRYIPSKNAFIVVNSIDENVFVYKLTSASGSGTTSPDTGSSSGTSGTDTGTSTGTGGDTTTGSTTPTPVPVPAPATAPAMQLSTSSATINSGDIVTLNWSVTDATACTASGGWSGSKATSGQELIGPVTANSSYTLTCEGAGGSVSKSVDVAVQVVDNGGTNSAPTPPTDTNTGNTVEVTGITTVEFDNNAASAQYDVPVTFGHVFKQGDVPAGKGVIARLADGTQVPMQVDEKTTHADGSVAHAVLTAVVPYLSANGKETVTLTSETPASAGASLKLSDLLATSFDAKVSLNVGGTVYSASAADLLRNGKPKQWLAGDKVSEWVVGGPVKAGGSAHPHLTAYFHVRAYAGFDRVRVDAVVENNWTYVSNPHNITYDATISVGGNTVYSKSGLEHFHHARWHKVFWYGENPKVYAKLNTRYLQDSKAIPKYVDVKPSEGYLNGLIDSIGPMSNGMLENAMHATGESPSIGPLPTWTSVYAVSGDQRAYRATLLNGDGGGAYGVHYRDEANGMPVSIDDHPNTSVSTGAELPSAGGANPYKHDLAHQPSIAYVPYLVSGDYYYLEELQFWATYNMLYTSPGTRVNQVGLQNRGQAWSLRTLGQAAYATPDDHPLKAYFRNRVTQYMKAYDNRYTNNPNANKLGVVWSNADIASPDKLSNAYFVMWMDDYITWAVGYLAELGFTEAESFRDWKAAFPANRMGGDEWCWQVATPSHVQMGVGETWYTSLRQVYQANFPSALTSLTCNTQSFANWVASNWADENGFFVNEMIKYGNQPWGHPSKLRPALAIAVDAGVPNALKGWERLANRVDAPDYSDDPKYALVPRSLGKPVDPVTVPVPTPTPAPTPTPSPTPTPTPTPGSAPSVDLSASATSVNVNGTATLSWSATNAESCTASGAWSGDKALSGSEDVTPATGGNTYTLTCSGSGGAATDAIVVTAVDSGNTGNGTVAVPAPTVSLSASQSQGTVTLSWNASDADGCNASGAWAGAKGATGSESIASLEGQQRFQLACTGVGGTTASEISVNVTASPDAGNAIPSGAGQPTDDASGTATPGIAIGGTGSFNLFFLVGMAVVGVFVRRRHA